MSTIPLKGGPYRFFFYAGDGKEPPHVHVQRDEQIAKFWLDPVDIAKKDRYPTHELNRIKAIIQTNVAVLMASWEDFFQGE
jgi:hypothetical protein